MFPVPIFVKIWMFVSFLIALHGSTSFYGASANSSSFITASTSASYVSQGGRTK